MRRLWILWLVFLCAATLHAQPKLEFFGRVIEPGLRIPVPDATVRLWQYPTDPGVRAEFYNGTGLLETQTDATGQFHFTVPESGKYRVATTKTGYGPSGITLLHDSTAATVTLGTSTEQPPLELFLTRPGMLTGRLVDADTQKPVLNLKLIVRQTWFADGERRYGIGGMAITGTDGSFAFRGLTPNADYLVATLPAALGKTPIELAYPVTWWPGGHDVNSAIPTRVIASTPLSLGTLEILKQPVHEVRTTVDPESCRGKSTLSGRVGNDTTGYQAVEGIKCGEELVFSGLEPRTRIYLASSGNLPVSRLRAVAPVIVGTENVKLRLSLAPGHNIGGKILVGAPGMQLPPTPVSVRLFPLGGLPLADMATAKVNPAGDFELLNVGAGQYPIAIDNLPPGYCVQEIRHNNVVLRSTTLTVSPFSQAQTLTITLSDKPSTITGRVLDGDRPLPQAHVRAVAYPLPDGPRRDWRILRTEADADGRFTFNNLPSGEYRLIAVAPGDRYTLEEPHILENLAAHAETLEIRPAAAPNITLKAVPATLTH